MKIYDDASIMDNMNEKFDKQTLTALIFEYLLITIIKKGII